MEKDANENEKENKRGDYNESLIRKLLNCA